MTQNLDEKYVAQLKVDRHADKTTFHNAGKMVVKKVVYAHDSIDFAIYPQFEHYPLFKQVQTKRKEDGPTKTHPGSIGVVHMFKTARGWKITYLQGGYKLAPSNAQAATRKQRYLHDLLKTPLEQRRAIRALFKSVKQEDAYKIDRGLFRKSYASWRVQLIRHAIQHIEPGSQLEYAISFQIYDPTQLKKDFESACKKENVTLKEENGRLIISKANSTH